MILDDKLMKYVLFQKRTVQEVKLKCQSLGFTEEYIEEIIAYLIENGYLDDDLYTMKYILNVMKLKKKSIQEIRFDLLRRGINESIIEKYITKELKEYEIKVAIELAKKKYKACEDFLKVKKYLAGKGYSREVINKVIDSLKEISDKKDYLYAGFSAGVCVLASDLHGFELVDNQSEDPYNYGKTIWTGIGLIDYNIVPHFDTPSHPESPLMYSLVSYLEKENKKYKTLRDGEVIISDITYDKII